MKRFSPKAIWGVIKGAASCFSDNRVLKLSASLAYYTVFSLGPMMIVIIFLADIFYGRQAIEGSIYGQLSGLVGREAAAQVQETIKNSAALTSKSNLTAVIGIITLVIGATSVFAEIQDSINLIWGLKAKPKKGWLKMLTNRLLSFSILVSLGFLLLVSLVINGLLEGLMGKLQQMFPQITVVVVYIINLAITFMVTTILFGIIFKVLPDARIKWKDVLIGSMATAGLFMLGKFGITFYIGSSNIGSAYGAAGSLVVLLVWVYYSAVILYFGAEFTKIFAAQYGSAIIPNNYAVWIKQVEVEEARGSLKQIEEKKKRENENTPETVKVK
jgi:membrane protein